jgi:hypothetical protein
VTGSSLIECGPELVAHLRRTGEAWANSGAPFHRLLVNAADEIDRLQGRLTRIADETRDHPGLGLIYHYAIGTHDEDIARV